MTEKPGRRRPPLQFGIGTMLAATTALAVLLAALRWIGAPPLAVGIVLAIVAVAVVAAVALAVALGRMIDANHQQPPSNHHE